MAKPKQLAHIWEDKFGEDYTNRKLRVHKSEGGRRVKFWGKFTALVPEAKSYLEIGCNAGMNLEALHKARPRLKLTAIEPMPYACEVARAKSGKFCRIINTSVYDLPASVKADLAFTCTVLIHIAPADLKRAMKKIYHSSKRYILAMEYYWPTVKQVEYRGLKQALWKRDFGALWLRSFPLELKETGYVCESEGFYRVTWWLFEKKTGQSRSK